ncbi:MAG TPA: hypothetical protein VF186_06790 [Gaiellaceae bacterium]
MRARRRCGREEANARHPDRRLEQKLVGRAALPRVSTQRGAVPEQLWGVPFN